MGDYIYGMCRYGELRCLKAANGDRVWEDLTATQKVRWGAIHMVRNGDRMWLFSEGGELIIARLSPAGYEQIDRTQQPRADLCEPRSARAGSASSGPHSAWQLLTAVLYFTGEHRRFAR